LTAAKALEYRPRSAVSIPPLARQLRVLQLEEVKSVAYAPVSHPFVERLIGTVRREYLDRVFFWNVADLMRKLEAFRDYYNASRVHRSLDGATPAQRTGCKTPCSCCA
jgi:putative transposase